MGGFFFLAQVTHLDGSKSAVEWAKRNVEALAMPPSAVRYFIYAVLNKRNILYIFLHSSIYVHVY